MRAAVLALGLAGCATPSSVPAPPVGAEIAPAPRDVKVKVQRHVPQDAPNLEQLERTRRSERDVARDLACGKFVYGDDLADVTAVHNPDVVFRHGDYATAVYADGSYFGSLTRTFVIARDGKLVRAFGSSCVWRPIFFDGQTDADRAAWDEGFQKAEKAYLGALVRRRAELAETGPPAPIPHPRER